MTQSDPTYIAQVMTQIEKQIHATGWGHCKPTLYRVSIDDRIPLFGSQLTIELYSVSGFEFDGRYGPTPEAELVNVVPAFEHPKMWLFMSDSGENIPSRPVAHIFMSEAWHITGYRDETEFTLEAAGRSLKDLPGAALARYLIAVTDEDCLVMFRPYDKQPRWISAEQFGTPSSPVQDSLNRIHAAEVGNWKQARANLN